MTEPIEPPISLIAFLKAFILKVPPAASLFVVTIRTPSSTADVTPVISTSEKEVDVPQVNDCGS